MNTNRKEEQNQKLPPADTGNASNPSPHNKKYEPATDNQLLNKNAEEYLRESANIEDEADAQDQADADKIIEKERKPQKD